MTRSVRSGARSGFTLLEIAVVLAVTLIGGLLVLPKWSAPLRPDGFESPHIDRERGVLLVDALRAARSQAIRARHTVTVHLDRNLAGLRVDTAGANGSGIWYVGPLPLDAGESLETEGGVLNVMFHPSGASYGQPILLRHARGMLALRIDPWNGEVTRVAR